MPRRHWQTICNAPRKSGDQDSTPGIRLRGSPVNSSYLILLIPIFSHVLVRYLANQDGRAPLQKTSMWSMTRTRSALHIWSCTKGRPVLEMSNSDPCVSCSRFGVTPPYYLTCNRHSSRVSESVCAIIGRCCTTRTIPRQTVTEV